MAIDSAASRARRGIGTRGGSWRHVAIPLALAALLIVASVTVLPAAAPRLKEAMRQNPAAPLLVTACWLLATSAFVTGKRIVAAGHLTWADTIAAHIGGTVANRVVPAGAGAAGVFLAALRRGGASTASAVGMVALWAAAGGLAHAAGFLFGVAWLRGGASAVALVVLVTCAVITAAIVVSRRRGTAAMALSVRWRTSGRTSRPPVPLSRTARGRAARNRLRHAASVIHDVLAQARAHPAIAVAAVAAQLVAVTCLAIGFAAATAVLGVPVTATASIAAYLTGTALSATTPTPAGIGSAETALVAALVVAGATVSEALPAVLLFRAVILLAPVAAAALIAGSRLLRSATALVTRGRGRRVAVEAVKSGLVVAETSHRAPPVTQL
ncbi:lysylphosphatidylglycerol synthase domain-containing protein [Phytoactinopolyspora endophytica]|uniref:lysylphosphatidylglycerol synthase domain-containing protein n=1 Tax=Phytoactinopolyspora endophytica TaxID=1642495 RepID=UPI00101B6E6B|nr:lysylphosphatidylglycerol synthase domain-containing protein [Phytoactinopolyspora endophytica]